MKKFLLLAAAAILGASCINISFNNKNGVKPVKGEGEVITRSFDLSGFDTIIVNGSAEVTFVQTAGYEVTLSTQENIFEWVDYHVKGSTLYIETLDQRPIRAKEYDVTIKAPVLKSLTVNGAAELKMPAGLRLDGDLSMEINGAGDLDLSCISCDKLSLSCNGAADVDMFVETTGLKVIVCGAGDVNIGGCTADAYFEVNGVGDIDARELEITGSVQKSTAGAASVKLKK